MESDKKQWHPAFCVTMELEFRKNKNMLKYHREYNLSKKPLQIDLLIIKKEKDEKLENEIGDFFLGHNIVEYKSPGDGLNAETFYKVIGYASLYKFNTGKTDEIFDTDITITLVRENKPIKLMKQLAQKYEMTKRADGIYWINGMLFPLQVIVTKELDLKLHPWLKSLTRSMKDNEAENLLNCFTELTEPDDKYNADVVMDFVSSVNESVFKAVLKGADNMTEALKELVAPELKELRLMINNKDAELANSKTELANSKTELANKDTEIANKNAELERLKKLLAEAGISY